MTTTRPTGSEDPALPGRRRAVAVRLLAALLAVLALTLGTGWLLTRADEGASF